MKLLNSLNALKTFNHLVSVYESTLCMATELATTNRNMCTQQLQRTLTLETSHTLREQLNTYPTMQIYTPAEMFSELLSL
jgi:hypothetical protein